MRAKVDPFDKTERSTQMQLIKVFLAVVVAKLKVKIKL